MKRRQGRDTAQGSGGNVWRIHPSLRDARPRHLIGGFRIAAGFNHGDPYSALASARLLPETSLARVAAISASRSPSSTPWVSEVS